MTVQTIVQNISALPIWSKVQNEHGTTSIDWERYHNSIQSANSSLVQRAQSYIVRNPDFNVLSANGYNPVTESSPNLTQILSQWYVNNGTGNTFTLTPTVYTNSQRPVSGSNNYLNVSVSNLASTLSMYNQNYSTTGQFRGDPFSGSLISLSAIINNNNGAAPKLRFVANTSNYGTTNGYAFYLQPNLNLISTQLQMPDLSGQNLGSNPYTQFQFNIEDAYGSPLDFDLYYIKAEVSNYSSPLIVNHILETYVCQNLT